MENIVNSVLIAEAIAAAPYTHGTSDPTSAAVDVQMCQKIAGVIDVGAMSGSTITASLTECETSGGSYTTIAGQSGTATITAAGKIVIEARPTMKFAKIAIVGTNAKTDTICGLILGINPVHAPIV